jgi:hypothetical protein
MTSPKIDVAVGAVEGAGGGKAHGKTAQTNATRASHPRS